MNFIFDQNLQDYMQKKKKTSVVVEVVTSNNSDFEVTELYVHLADQKGTDFFKTKKHFKGYQAPVGEVLLPPYRLEYEDTVTFGLKSFLWVKYVTHQGIRL